MNRRGLTMLELLLALGLLSMVMAVLTSWIQTTVRTSATFGAHARWRNCAETVLQLIRNDLACGDFASSQDKDKTAQSRVRVESEILIIATRHDGPMTARYALDPVHGKLMLTANHQGQELERLLIGQVERFETVLDVESQVLDVMITSVTGDSIERRFALR